MTSAVDAFYFEPDGEGKGQRYCIFRRAKTLPCRGAVVYVHPFAEEMNKSRRMAALQAAALADAGFAVLQIDLQGCGDSSGDFNDASWQGWVDDAAAAARWLGARHPAAPLWFWGLRCGGLVAAEAARQMGMPCNFLFWQPALDGAGVLHHFLRLQVVGAMLDGRAKNAVAALKQQLAEQRAVEVAGYLLASALASGLDSARLRPPDGGGRVVWLEVSPALNAKIGPASLLAIEQWQRAGFEVQAAVVAGPAFWQTSEVEEAPQLIAATLQRLQNPRSL